MSKACARCEKSVYPTEELKCLDKVWHKSCFKCQTCGMILNMKTYKGFNKFPYCEAHIPKAKATTVVETPEMKRLAENTKIQSQVQYHADFEKAKGKFTQVADDPEMLRIKANSKIISNVLYHGELEKKAAMDQKRTLGDEAGGSADNAQAEPPYPVAEVPSSGHQKSVADARIAVSAQPPHHQHHHQPPPPPQQHHQQPEYRHRDAYSQAAQYQQQAQHNAQIHHQQPVAQHTQHQNLYAQRNVPEPNPAASANYQRQHQMPQPVHHQGYSNQTNRQYQSSAPSYEQNANYLMEQQRQSSYQHSKQQQQPTGHVKAPYQQQAAVTQRDPYAQMYQQQQQQQKQQQKQVTESSYYSSSHHGVSSGYHHQPPPARAGGRSFRAMYDYDADEDDEVSFRDGDVIVDCKAIDDGWMIGTVLRTGRSGMVPANYLEPMN